MHVHDHPTGQWPHEILSSRHNRCQPIIFFDIGGSQHVSAHHKVWMQAEHSFTVGASARVSAKIYCFVHFLGYCASSFVPAVLHSYVQQSRPGGSVFCIVASTSTFTFCSHFFPLRLCTQWSQGCFQPSRAGPSFFARYINCSH